MSDSEWVTNHSTDGIDEIPVPKSLSVQFFSTSFEIINTLYLDTRISDEPYVRI